MKIDVEIPLRIDEIEDLFKNIEELGISKRVLLTVLLKGFLELVLYQANI